MSNRDDAAGCAVFASVVLAITVVSWILFASNKEVEIKKLKREIEELQTSSAHPEPGIVAEADPRVAELQKQLAESKSREVWSPVEALQAELKSHQNEILILHKKIDSLKLEHSGSHCRCKAGETK